MRGKLDISGAEEHPKSVLNPVRSLHVERLKDQERRRTISETNSIVSTDFETAITKSGFGRFNLVLMLLAIPAAWTSGFVSGSMSYVIPVATKDLDLGPNDKAMLQSACYVGMISGGFLWGFMSDTFGRQKLLVTGFLLDCVMNFLTAIVGSLPLMLFFKFLSGFMVCGPYSIFTAYISEVFLSQRRDIAVLSAGIFNSLGNIVQSGLAILIIPYEVPFGLPLKSWQMFHILCGIPSLVCGLSCLFCVESPKFLVDHGQHEKALKVCRTIYTINTGNDPSTYPVKRLQHQVSKTEKKQVRTILIESVAIFKAPFIKRAALSFIIQIGIVASANILRLWLPEMLMLVHSSSLDPDLGFCPLLMEGNNAQSNTTVSSGSQSDTYIMMMWVNGGSVASHLLFLLTVKYFGKKMILIACATLAGACAVTIPLISADYVFISAALFSAFFNVAFYANIGIVVSVFPTKVRATSVCMTLVFGRIGILLINFVIANLMYSYCQYIFYALGVLSIGISVLGAFLSQKPIDDVVPADPERY